MTRPRTTARGLLTLLLLWALPATAEAGSVPEKLIFPVVGKSTYTDDFGAPRAQGGHEGNDIVAPRRAPVVAVEPGRVELWTSSWRAGCMLYLHGRSGTTYLYVHLNNDLTRKNDNRGGCRPGVAYPRGLRSGQRVGAGRLIGYVGDSGDADGIHPHLHFELHPRGGRAVSPYRWLKQARKLLFTVPPGTKQARVYVRGKVRWVRQKLAVRIGRVAVSTGGRADFVRYVYLAIAPDVVVERTSDGARATAQLADAERGERVAVVTKPVKPSLGVLLGKPGKLATARVVLRGTATAAR